MDETKSASQEWLEGELAFIADKMGHTLNARMKPQFESCDEQARTVVLRFPLEEWEVNGLGTLHGGMISTMMDLTMSIAVYCFSRQAVPPTVSMSVNYLRPVPMEGYVLIEAEVTSLGRRNATASCKAVVPKTGKTACTAIGTYAILPKPSANG